MDLLKPINLYFRLSRIDLENILYGEINIASLSKIKLLIVSFRTISRPSKQSKPL
jgi:hypothetical protein